MYRNLIVLGILCYLCVDGLRFSDLYKDDEENSQLEKVVTKRLEEGDKSFPVRLRRVKNRRFSDGMGKYAVRNLSGGDKHANSVKPNLALTPATPLHLSLSSLSKDVTPGAIYREIKYDGEGCHWFGVAPFCNENCPLDYDHIRSHNGHCSLTELLEGRLNCIPDRSFGKPCWNVGGEKHLCCKGQTIYCSWNGRWSSSKKAYNTNCQFYRSNNHCGRLHCSINNENIKINVMAAEKDAEFEANRKAVRSIENRSELVILNAPEDAFAAHTASTHEQRRIRNRSDTHKENSSATPTQVYDQTAYYQSPELVNMSSTIDVKTNRASKEKKADGGSKSVGGGGGGGSSGGRNAYGCFWHGIAPFCKESCPLEFDFIRSHSGHCTFQEFFSGKMNCIPDDNFGKACWNFGKKHLCCKGKTAGCTWNGVWTSSLKAYNIHCKHHPGGECGEVRCFISNHWYKDYDENVVEGEHCNKVQLFDFEGSMTCGFVAWTDEHGNHADAWYKIR